MSDTANTGNLASSDEFDARLKRADENRWLATRYAPPAARQRLVAVYLLHNELQRALSASEPMLGKIRIQWWRETLDGIACGSPRRHDLALELSRAVDGRGDLLGPLNDLVNCFDDVIDDHLHTGKHEDSSAHEARHLAAEAALARLAGLSLQKDVPPPHLEVLTRTGEAYLAIVAELPDASARFEAAAALARRLPAPLWPAIVHIAAQGRQADGNRPLLKRWRVLQAMLSRRL